MKIPYKYAVALTAALGLFMAVLDNTIVNVALTAMQKTFKTDVNTIQWVITAYFLAQAAVIPAAGYLSNRFGIKLIFMLSLGLFTIGSLLCGLSYEIGGDSTGAVLLIVFRVIQGIGGGALFPLATSIALSVFPPQERAGASAITGVPVLLAPAFGPTIGGLIIDSVGWEWMFFINVPVGIIALFLIARVLKSERREGPIGQSRFDYLGLVLSMLGVILVVYAFTLVGQTEGSGQGATVHGWGYWPVWALLIGGLIILVGFSFYETKLVKDPVLDLSLFKERDFLVSTVMTWVIRGVIFGSFFLLPLFLQQLKGYSAVEAGLTLMPQGLAAAVAIAVGSRLYDKIGPRNLVLLGYLMLIISTVMLVFISKDSDGWSFLPILAIRGLGFGWSGFPLQTVALSAIVGRALPKASSLYNASAQIFSSIGVAMISTFFIQETSNRAAELVANARATNTPPPADLALQAGVSGMSHVFLIVAILTAISALLSFLLPNKSLKQQAGAPGNTSDKAGEEMPHPVVMEA